MLKRVINCYWVASGHAVNVEKWNLYFSANTREEIRRSMEDATRIKEVRNLEKYLL